MNIMKKALLATATLSLLLTSGAAFAQSDNFSTGSVSFIGEVSTGSCDMAPVDDVKLGSVTVKKFADANAHGSWGTTTIKFEGCDLGEGDDKVQSMTLTVVGDTAHSGNADLWPNAGLANNVGVEVEIDGKKLIPADGLVVEKQFGANATTMNFSVRGRMVSTGSATAGDVKLNLPFVADFL